MHIGINAHLLNTQESYRGAGVSSYSQQLVQAFGQLLAAGQTAHRFTLFLNEEGFRVPGLATAVSRWPTRWPPARIAWEQTLFPLMLAQYKVDLVHGLVNVLPLASRIPGVVTVHDLSFVRVPGTLPPAKRFYLARLCQASVSTARRVIAVSRQTADDLMRFMAVPAAKIVVVPNGVDPRFRPAAPQHVEAFRRRRRLPQRYLLYLGTLEPRKDLATLIAAYDRWRAQAPLADRDVALVLAGARGWYYEEIFRQVEALGLTQQVLFPGYLPADELPDWYRAAEGFVYPSLFEGFGLPVLEAMACGVPVLCSRAASLLEVVGESSLTFPAGRRDELAYGLALLTSQPALRLELSRRGLAQAARFSWARTAQETVAVYAGAI